MSPPRSMTAGPYEFGRKSARFLSRYFVLIPLYIATLRDGPWNLDPPGPHPRRSAAGEQFPPVLAQFPRRRDMPVQGLPGNSQLLAQCCDAGFGLAHRRHRQVHLGRGHFKWSPALAPTGPGRLQAGLETRGCWYRGSTPQSRNTGTNSGYSPSAAKAPKTSLPWAVVVSTEAPWPVKTFRQEMSSGRSSRCCCKQEFLLTHYRLECSA